MPLRHSDEEEARFEVNFREDFGRSEGVLKFRDERDGVPDWYSHSIEDAVVYHWSEGIVRVLFINKHECVEYASLGKRFRMFVCCGSGCGFE